ncbi:DNA-directed RNA polymerase [Candidatus Woesearchaeota archaeon]|nr:DNA-directed RNA polymerase [Candidatus Woesearchaeota archaeon]|tara:strand:+ start:1137 stop:1301 length:165 start_codon:yes stop_codon:yes gene_type:complete
MAEFDGGKGGGFGGPREMHPATCTECGKDCEVPFKPTEGKPVYCKDCYMKRKKF